MFSKQRVFCEIGTMGYERRIYLMLSGKNILVLPLPHCGAACNGCVLYVCLKALVRAHPA